MYTCELMYLLTIVMVNHETILENVARSIQATPGCTMKLQIQATW